MPEGQALSDALWFRQVILEKLKSLEISHGEAAKQHQQEFLTITEKLGSMSEEIASFRPVKTAVFALIGMILSAVFLAIIMSVIITKAPAVPVQATPAVTSGVK